MQRNAQKRLGMHRKSRKRRIMPDKGHHKRPMKKQMNMNFPYADVVDDVLFLVMLLQRLYE